MHGTSYSWLKSHKEQLGMIAEAQIALDERLDFDIALTNQLRLLLERLRKDDLKVLIMGMFNSGKSTFINALLGKKVLPAKMLPTTAIICETRYSDTPKCVLFPKPGKYIVDGRVKDDPFEIRVEELDKYVIIQGGERAGQRSPEECPFARMILYWPLGICKDGVELTDSPGLNDPNSHDVIALNYLPHTDAILYCMSAASAFTRKDKDTIEELVATGYKSIIFIITNLDRIREAGEEAEFTAMMRANLSAYTGLGEEGILFVNALGGVQAKERKDEKLLQESNLPLAEKAVEVFLVSQRGKARLELSLSRMKSHHETVERFLRERLHLNALGAEALRAKYDQLNEILTAMKTKRDLVMSRLELGTNDILIQATDMGRVYLQSLDEKVEAWVEGFTPEGKISLLPPWKLNESVKSYVDEYIDHVKYRMRQEGINWINGTLYPMVRDEMVRFVENTGELQKSYEGLEQRFRMEASMEKVAGMVEKAMEPNTGTRLGSLIYGIFSGDLVGAGMGMVFGLRGLLSSLVAQLSAGILIGIAMLFTPIGWPALIIGVIVAAIASGAWNMNMLPARVKGAIIENTRKALANTEMQESMIADIKKPLKEDVLDKVFHEAQELFAKDIDPKEKALKEALQTREAGEEAVAKERAWLVECADENQRIAGMITDVGRTILSD